MIAPLEVVLSRLEPYRLRANGADRWRACCPAHGSSNPSSLAIGVGTNGAVLLQCFGGCGVVQIAHSIGIELGDLFDARTALLAAPLPRPAPVPKLRDERRTPLVGWAATLFRDDCRSVKDATSNVAAQYLRARRCCLPPADGDLRWHPNLRHPSGYRGPALVALVSDARTREPMSIHRTWIQANGRKAEIDSPRLLLSGHAKVGGVIRLWPDESVSAGLGIAEGVETALSLAHAMPPVWSLIDAGNLAAFPVLSGISALTIAADHDPAGRKAATACGERWAAAGAAVRVVLPPQAGHDLNDLVLEAVA